MCQYFSKTEHQCSQAMKQAAKESFVNSMHHHDTMNTIATANLSNHECSVQGAVYHNLLELKLRRILPAVDFVNINLPEEGVQVLFPEKELSELRDKSPNILKISNVYLYMERPSEAFCNGKYRALNAKAAIQRCYKEKVF